MSQLWLRTGLRHIYVFELNPSVRADLTSQRSALGSDLWIRTKHSPQPHSMLRSISSARACLPWLKRSIAAMRADWIRDFT